MSNTITSVNDEISVQLDDNLRRALTHLRSTGLTDEQNIQQAILDTARNLFDATRLKAQLDALDADPEDRAEMKALHNQSDAFLPRSVVIIAPTSQSARPIVLRPQIEIGGDATRVVLDQIRAVSIDRLKDRVGSIEIHEQWAIDDAIRALFGLN